MSAGVEFSSAVEVRRIARHGEIRHERVRPQSAGGRPTIKVPRRCKDIMAGLVCR
jgi:hypothetical protein